MSLQALFGDCCQVPAPGASGTIEISLSAAQMEKLVSYWKTLSGPAKPRLRGLTVSGPAGKQEKMHVLVSPAGPGATVLISADISRGQAIPHLHEIWPYACWWESELRSFESIKVKERPDRRENGGVAWRLS